MLKVEKAPIVIALSLIATPTVADGTSELARCELEAERLFPPPHDKGAQNWPVTCSAPCKIDTPEGSYELEAEWLITFGREMSIWFGTREVRLLAAGRGHTAGNSICWLPQDRVLFTGDLLEQRATTATHRTWLPIRVLRRRSRRCSTGRAAPRRA